MRGTDGDFLASAPVTSGTVLETWERGGIASAPENALDFIDDEGSESDFREDFMNILDS